MNCISAYSDRLRLIFSITGLIAAFFLPAFRGQAQNTPPCFQLFLPTLEAQVGDTVCVPLQVRNFNLIASMQFAVFWEEAAFDLVALDYTSSDLPGFGVLNFNVISNPQRILVSWIDLTGLGVTLPDSARLFNICLKVKSGANGFYPLKVGPNNSLFWPFEIIQEFSPNGGGGVLPLAQQVGGVRVGAAGPPGSLAIVSMCAEKATCGASVGSISIDVLGGQEPFQYQWAGPGNFTAGTQNVDSLPAGLYTVTVTDQNGLSALAEIEVTATVSGIFATPKTQAAWCGLPNGCVSMQVGGGTPPYTFAWPSGLGASHDTCGFLPGWQSVTVYDANGCTQPFNFYIPDDHYFQVHVIGTNIKSCGGLGSATVIVENGQPPFEYLWSNGDTTSTIDSLSVGSYQVTVTSPGGCTASKGTQVADETTYAWSFQINKACIDYGNSPEGSLYLQSAFNAGLDYPLTISWSDGTTRLITELPEGAYLDTLSGVPSGHYSVTVSDPLGCSATVSTVLNCVAYEQVDIPDSLTAFYIQDEYLTPQYAVDSCTGIYARHFNEVYSLEFDLAWDPIRMSFKEIKNLDLPGLTPADFNLTSGGRLKLSWSDPSALGVSLPENSRLFEVCFLPKTPDTYRRVDFDNGRLGAGPAGNQPFMGRSGNVLFGLYFPLGPSVCEFAVLDPSCTSDGYYRVAFEGCDPDDPLLGYYTHEGVSYNDLTGLMFADSGSYSIYTTQINQSGNWFYVYIPSAGDTTSCVWPGDADDNNAVNHHDLLYIGLAYHSTGAVRNGASDEWTGQDCPDWAKSTATRQINYKHIDSNGDGTIDAADTLAIVQHWGRVVNPLQHNPFHAPLGNPTGNPHPPFTISTDTLYPGQSISLPLLLGSADMPADSIYGLAFSLSYDPDKIKPGISFHPTSSWLGEPADMLWLQRNFPEQGRLDVAITRTDGMPVSGWGAIGDVFVIIEDDIFFGSGDEETPAKTTGDSLVRTTMFFSGLNSLRARATTGMLDAPPVELWIRDKTSAAQEPAGWDRRLTLAPNPANDYIRIASPVSNLRRIDLVDATGASVSSFDPGGARVFLLPLSQLPNGSYLVRIFTGDGVAVRKLIIGR